MLSRTVHMIIKRAMRDDVDSLLQTLNRFIPRGLRLRQRQILTRRGTVRMRFVVFPGLGFSLCALMLVSTFSTVADSTTMSALHPVILGAAPAAVVADNSESANGSANIFDNINVIQKRMKRMQGDASEVAHLAMLDPGAGAGADSDADAQQAHNPTATPDTSKEQVGQQEKTVKIGSGDTLTGVLGRAGLSSGETYNVVEAVKTHIDMRKLKPGLVLNIKFDPVDDPEADSKLQFASLDLAIDPLRTVSVARDEAGDGYKTDLTERPVHKQLYVRNAPIEVSVFGSAAKAGIPQAVIADAIRIYSWHVDFQRDIRQGDNLQVMYEQFETDDGKKIKTGNVVYAKLTVGGVDIPIYRHEMKDGHIDYFLKDGRSIRKTLMKTPIDGARMSSGFGMRQHPIQGYNKMHKGIDFAASTGTPIYAAGDGVVELAGRRGGYGNYVRIRHNSQLKTAYAHMSRFAKGVATGDRVHQGDVIGYVGTTGSSTGPHLHYEVMLNGVQVNPRGVNLPTGEILEGEQLKIFQANMRDIDRARNTSHGVKVALLN